MKVKTALRFYLIPIRVTIIKKLNDKNACKVVGKRNLYSSLNSHRLRP